MLKSVNKGGVKKSIVEKWAPILDGFQKAAFIKPSKRDAFAQVLENEAKFVKKSLKENNSSIGNFLGTGGTSALGTVPFYIGVVRRGYPKLIGMNLFGVQALKQPGGVLFAVKRTLQGSTNQQSTTGQVSTFNSKVLYLDKYLKINGTGIVTITVSDGASTTKDFNVIYADDKFVLIHTSTTADLDWLDTDYTFDYNPGTGVETYTIKDIVTNQAMFDYLFKEYTMFYDADSGQPQNDDFAGDDIREAGTDIIRVSITNIKSRKIKSKLSQELIEDMSAYGHDIQNDLMNMMMEDITSEMNREFLWNIRNKSEAVLPTYDFSADTDDPLDKYVKIVSKATLLSNKIAQDLKSGTANYMVVSPGVLSAFTALSKYWFASNPTIINQNLGGNEFASDPFVGKFNDWWNLYVDIYAPTGVSGTDESVLVGYYSNNNLDNAFYYLPYIALVPDVMKDPNDGQWRIIYRTRYAIQENPFGAERWIKRLDISGFSV